MIVVSERDSAGIFKSAYNSALRGLGDVELVNTMDEADLTLSVIVSCAPERDCTNPLLYAFSTVVLRPIHEADFAGAMTFGGYPKSDSLKMRKAFSFLGSYYKYLQNYVGTFSKDGYAAGIRNLIAQFDTKCLDRYRILKKTHISDEDWKLWRDDTKWDC